MSPHLREWPLARLEQHVRGSVVVVQVVLEKKEEAAQQVVVSAAEAAPARLCLPPFHRVAHLEGPFHLWPAKADRLQEAVALFVVVLEKKKWEGLAGRRVRRFKVEDAGRVPRVSAPCTA